MPDLSQLFFAFLSTFSFEDLPMVLGVLGLIFSMSVLAMKYMSLETTSIFEGFSYIFTLLLCLPFKYLIKSHSKHQHKPEVVIFLSIGISFFILLIVRNVYLTYVKGKVFKILDLGGKVYIITGSNTGIGFETSREIVRMGGVVIMACRTPKKAEEAKADILRSTGKDTTKIIVMQLDLSSFKSVRKFVEDFHDKGMPLHCLINNAGAFQEKRSLTEDNIEACFQSNHLSSFLLTHLLMKDLEKTGGRIVNLTSSLHKKPRAFNFSDYMSENNFTTFGAYEQSKLANVMTTIEQSNRLAQSSPRSKVTCNCVHPGIVKTEVSRNLGAFLYYGQLLATPILMFMQKTPLQGAYCSIYAATSPDLEGICGLYLQESDVAEVGRGATRPDDNKKLWELSEQLTGIVTVIEKK